MKDPKSKNHNPKGKNGASTAKTGELAKSAPVEIKRGSEEFPVSHTFLAPGDKVRIRLAKSRRIILPGSSSNSPEAYKLFSHIIFPRYATQKPESFDPYAREFNGTIMAILPELGEIKILFHLHYPFDNLLQTPRRGATIYTNSAYKRKLEEIANAPVGGKRSELSGIPLGQRWEIAPLSITSIVKRRKLQALAQLMEIPLTW